MPGPLFVGRSAEMTGTLGLLGGGGGAVMALIGMHGMGKTALLDQITREASGIKDVVVVPVIDMATVEDAQRDLADDGEGTAASLVQRFHRSQRLMSRLAELTGSHEFGPFRDRLQSEQPDVSSAVVGNQVTATKSTVEHNTFTATSNTTKLG